MNQWILMHCPMTEVVSAVNSVPGEDTEDQQ